MEACQGFMTISGQVGLPLMTGISFKLLWLAWTVLSSASSLTNAMVRNSSYQRPFFIWFVSTSTAQVKMPMKMCLNTLIKWWYREATCKMRGYLYGHGGSSELLFVEFHKFLTYVYEKHDILKLSVWFMQINICGVLQQHLGGLEGVFHLSWLFLGIYIKVLPNFISKAQ